MKKPRKPVIPYSKIFKHKNDKRKKDKELKSLRTLISDYVSQKETKKDDKKDFLW